MKAYVFLAAVLIIIPLFLFATHKNLQDCSCKGLSFGNTYCFGTLSCETVPCIPLTCESADNLFGKTNTTQEVHQTYTILMIDASKSMEGENLNETIKASKELAQKLEENEHVAVIEFNEKAQALTGFTNDRITLFKSIDLISPKGRTNFYEPFALANELFDKTPEEVNKYVLFLSDGAPEDNQEAYMKEVSLLKEKNVKVYTLAFAGKSNEALMKQIATSEESIFTVTSAQDIEEKFSQIYSTIVKGGNFNIIIDIPPAVKTTEELKGTLISTYTAENILLNNNFCEIPLLSYLETKGTKTSRIVGTITEGTVHFPLVDLVSGTYSIIAHATIDLGDCSFSTTEQAGTLQVIKEEDCQVSCENITALLKGDKNETYQRKDDRSISWNILIDKSSSMSSDDKLTYAIEDTKKFISFLPVQDTVSIGSFDNKVDLISTHQQSNTMKSLDLQTIVPSSSTQLLVALKKAKELEQSSPTQNVHTIIISDGNYLQKDLVQIKEVIQSLQGCISTINYGTHLLTTKEEAFDYIKTYRSCGEDIITRPTLDELQFLANTSLSNIPHLVVQVTRQEGNESTTVEIKTISSFTGITPEELTGQCYTKPKVETIITPENGAEKITNDNSIIIS
ncbi:MAG: VWA domain-containing protein, partial [Nanoarchaeota archaeon]|nr:VWA domain-containing protein [Nanoarchaeota archaeon]